MAKAVQIKMYDTCKKWNPAVATDKKAKVGEEEDEDEDNQAKEEADAAQDLDESLNKAVLDDR